MQNVRLHKITSEGKINELSVAYRPQIEELKIKAKEERLIQQRKTAKGRLE